MLENLFYEILPTDLELFYDLRLFSPKREWADPGGTAIPGQPVEGPKQAPETPPSAKNQFNIVETQWAS